MIYDVSKNVIYTSDVIKYDQSFESGWLRSQAKIFGAKFPNFREYSRRPIAGDVASGTDGRRWEWDAEGNPSASEYKEPHIANDVAAFAARMQEWVERCAADHPFEEPC